MVDHHMSYISGREGRYQILGKTSRKKAAVLLDFVQMRGEGEGPAQIFWHLFISAFLVNKRSLIPPKCQQFEL